MQALTSVRLVFVLNSHAWQLQVPIFNIQLPFKLVAFDEIHAALDGPGGWDGFYTKFPESGGYIELSAVGFNPDKTVAVVYVGHHCGSTCEKALNSPKKMT